MKRKRVEVDGRTAYVSGAGSGMGRVVAVRLAAHGCPVAIVDQDQDGLRETAELIAGPVLARRLEVRDRQAQMAFAAEVAQWAPAPLGMVLNNAGVATSQSIADGSIEDDEWVLEINLGGVINGTRAFLPILLAQNSGVIVNTSSVFGLVGMPFQSAYCTSKFAVRGFTESLRHELRETGVRAVTIHPGGVRTNIARNARYHAHPTRPALSHEEAARHFDAIALTLPSAPPRSSTSGSRPVAAGSSSAPTRTCSTPWRAWRPRATSTSSPSWTGWLRAAAHATDAAARSPSLRRR